ncbi:MAG: SDR family NAD(P)-dependent oxidoreductase [Frankiales bacterium]|nr:SDR family NAD(P)-dependent oxidoreductase [Frankiales bacterium]
MTRPVAVVTGGGGGLGRVLVDRLDAEGFDVLPVDVLGTERVLDVTDAAACRALADEVRPRVWVNNAGVLGAGDAATQPDEVVERVVRVTLLGVLHGTRAAVASMRAHGGGHVVSIASLASWVPVPGEAVYAAAKAGVLSYTLSLAAELRAQGVEDVRLSAVCPDGMLTPMVTDVLDDDAVAMSFTAPRLTTPEEVADRVAELLLHPRLVSSVPHWRGAQVRLFAAVPDAMLRAAPVFARIGRANLERARAQARRGSSRRSTTEPPSA